MNVHYLTSYSNELYEVSGKHLIKSFFDVGMDKENNKISVIDDLLIEQDSFWKKWFSNNIDIIPEYFGGLAKPCRCPKPFSRKDEDHKHGCYYSWWNRNCSRWVRKIFAIKIYLQSLSILPEKLIWLDCDCIFLKNISHEYIKFIYRDNDLFYFRGPQRPVVECGIVGYSFPECTDFFESIYNMFITQEFRRLVRWDDCYTFQKMLKHFPDLKTIDWAGPKVGYGDVMSLSILRGLLIHEKGKHGRVLNLIQ